MVVVLGLHSWSTGTAAQDCGSVDNVDDPFTGGTFRKVLL